MPQVFKPTVKSSNLQHKNTFLKSNRQYLKSQQTVLRAPDSPCQTVLKFPELHARPFWIFSAFYSPLISQLSNLYFSTVQLVFLNRSVGYTSRVVVVTVSERVNEILGVLWLATMLRSRSPLCPPELSLSTPRPQLLTPKPPQVSTGGGL